MAGQKYGGIAYITLDGNQIVWSTEHANKTDILLNGSNFQNVVSVATLTLSALYGVAFLVILWEYLRRRGPRKLETDSQGKEKYKYSVGTAMGCMMLFYATDIYNRVEHEKKRVISSYYVAINIPLGIFPSLADGLILLYLLRRSPIKITDSGRLPRFVMYFAFAMYWLIGICTKGAQIWNVITQFVPPDPKCEGQETEHCKVQHGIQLSLNIEQGLDSAATGMLMIFSIGYALFAIGYIRHPPRTHSLQKRLSIAVGFLAALFVARNIVQFAFTLLYDQFHRKEPIGTQLVYVALWGLLSVGVYTSAVFVEATQKKEGQVIHGGTSQSLEGGFPYQASGWHQEKVEANVGTY